MATLKDIAERAGVSITTVSRALEGGASIRTQTQDRILKIVRELNYQPRYRRRRTASKASGLIGLIIHDVSNPFFAEIVKGVEDVLSGEGYSLIIGNSEDNNYKESVYLNNLIRLNVDGLLLFASVGEKRYLKRVRENRVPLFLIDCVLEDFDFVRTDNEKGAYLATQHLIGTGHRRIAFISGKLEGIWRLERLNGYRKALTDNAIEYDERLVHQGSVNKQHGYQAVRELLDLDVPPTAIFTQNDLIALGVLHALEDAGVSVPQEVAVVGYDNTELSSITRPALTSVAQPNYEMGHIAADLLLKKIRHRGQLEEETRIILQPRLVIRESSVVRKVL